MTIEIPIWLLYIFYGIAGIGALVVFALGLMMLHVIVTN